MDQRKALKLDICQYLTEQGVSREVIVKVCAGIKDAAENQAMGRFEVPAILSHMAERHHAKVERFIARLADIIIDEEPADDGEDAAGFDSTTDYYTPEGNPIFIPSGLKFLPRSHTVDYARDRGYQGK